MGYNQTSSAYDLSLFEERPAYVRTTKAEAGASRASRAGGKRAGAGGKAATPRQQAESREAEKNREARNRLLRVLAVGIMFAIAITMLVSNRVDYHELTREIDDANHDLTELEQEYEALRLQFDNKMSDSAVEDYAVSVLGMQKRENSQTEYISLNVGNVFEIADENSNDWYQTNLEKILSYSD